MFSAFGTVARGTRSTISSPKPSRPPYLAGLLVMSRIVVTPRSTRICAPMPYSRESIGSPRSSLASTVSRPSSCSWYARHLVAEADAAPFVTAEVDDDPLPLGRDLAECGVELHAAIATQRAEHVAGETLRVHPHEHVGLARHLTPHERDVLDIVEERPEHVGGEVAVLGRDPSLGDPLHQLLAAATMPNEVGDRDHEEPVLRGEHLELGEAGHRAVVVHHFGEHARGAESRQPGQVDRGLGVAGPLEHPTLAIAQREDVTGSGEVVGTGLRIDERLHRGRTVGSRDAGRGSEAGVDRHGERGAVLFGVVRHHQRELQLVAAAPRERHADHTARVADHEAHGFGRDLVGRHDEIAFVLAIGVVDHDHQLTACDRRDRGLDLTERHRTLASPGADAPRTSPAHRPPGSPDHRDDGHRASSPRACGG